MAPAAQLQTHNLLSMTQPLEAGFKTRTSSTLRSDCLGRPWFAKPGVSCLPTFPEIIMPVLAKHGLPNSPVFKEIVLVPNS